MLVILKSAKPVMSTYWVELEPVAMSKTIGMRRVTTWPSELVPVARIVSGYSPGPSDPPLIDTLIVWVMPLLRGKLDGVRLVAPMPVGSTPLTAGSAFGGPSMVRVIVWGLPVGANAREPLPDVPIEKDPVPVAPVVGIDTMRPAPVGAQSLEPTASAKSGMVMTVPE